MAFSGFSATACVVILAGVCLSPSGRLSAQAPPGPMTPSQPLPPPRQAPPPKKKPQVEPRKTLAGFWKLNTDQSDDPRKKLEEARQTKAGSGGGPGGGGTGPRVGVGFPYPGGGGNGPYGGGSGPELGGRDTETSERILQQVRPDYSQSVALTDAEVDSTNDQGNKMVFYTDGRKIQKSKNEAVQELAAHWNGAQLVTDEKGPQGRKMSRTFELSSDGRQFYETWRVENGKSGSAIVIRYVYDAANEYQD
jgi:hypothetical protein